MENISLSEGNKTFLGGYFYLFKKMLNMIYKRIFFEVDVMLFDSDVKQECQNAERTQVGGIIMSRVR